MAEAGEIVEHIDPDWRDHFCDVNEAADFYRKYAPVEWKWAVEGLS